MNTNFADVNDWLDLVSNVWVGLVLIAVAAIPAFISAKNSRGIKRIQDQVVNGHKDAPPLREDLDKVIAQLSETGKKVDLISADLTSLRYELSREEGRREVSDKELRDDFDRKFFDFFQRFMK